MGDTQNYNVEQLKRELMFFLEQDNHEGAYTEKIKQAVTERSFRVLVNINHVRQFNQGLAERIIRRPREHLIALQQAVQDMAGDIDPAFSKILSTAGTELQVGFEGSFGGNAVSPRGLMSNLLNNMVEVEGIVTRCSNVRPKMTRSVHFCSHTNNYTIRNYRDAHSMDIGIDVGGAQRMPTSSVLPTKDEEGHELELEYGYCQYKDYQTVLLQEMPERARVGQLPRSIEVILEHDLVDRVKPGDRVKCVGVYRPIAGSAQQGQTSGVFNSQLFANNIAVIGKEVGAVRLTGQDVANIREVSRREDILSVMAASLCPSIFGHEFIKKALILLLMGGCERNLENGTHLRGDINVLLVGDPSTAKSQLLRSVMDIAPLAISTTGRGSSGVGLTAAVTSDQETGERRLEAGAMVLADRGVVCVDEFDKMGENDRVAIHEVMEQQTVTIAKAGIHASLNARCSVLAAANPVYGQYDRTRRPQENIGLPDSLLSRFDLLFIVLDQMDPETDRRLSEHVIRSHQYRRPGTIMEPEPLNPASTLSLEDPMDSLADTPVWLRGGSKAGDHVDAAGNSSSSSSSSSATDLFNKDFLRKYIHFAKSRIQPVLSDAAMDGISMAYANMRSRQSKKNLPVTARSLETLIRLASAAAKVRLSNTVEEADVDAALELVNYVMFHEVGTPDAATTQGASSLLGKTPAATSTTSDGDGKRARVKDAEDGNTSESAGEDDVDAIDSFSGLASQAPVVEVDPDGPLVGAVAAAIAHLYEETGNDSIGLSQLIETLRNSIKESLKAQVRTPLIIATLKHLENENKVRDTAVSCY